ncbi:type IV pilus modification protein PilV [Congregibacter sp.]|jgi:type IV pilus assembly protein PilV|uniref:type IV pilus modification protein PilV n=1 Tax=Congregibacter sp. TaxID=2744308 RepID=UPI0039E4A6DA
MNQFKTNRKTRLSSYRRLQAQSGFTLIEVMVSVLILLIGLLGVAGMQMLSLQANQGAYFRSQAIYIGSEILDAMRANPTAAANYEGVYPDTIPGDQTCDDADGCTPQQAALQDLREWNVHFFDVFGVGAGNFRPSIPNGQAVITANGNEYTVQVSWTERQYDNAGDRARIQQVVNLTAALTP